MLEFCVEITSSGCSPSSRSNDSTSCNWAVVLPWPSVVALQTAAKMSSPQKCYITPAFSGIPNARRRQQNQKWSPTKGNKIRSGCLTPAFSGAQKRAKMLCHPCIIRDPQQRGTKSEVVATPPPSWGPKRGRICYVTPTFSGIPNTKHGQQNQKWSPTKGNKIRSGCLTPAFSGAQKRAEMLHHPCILRSPRTGFKKGLHKASGKKPLKAGDKIRSGQQVARKF